MNERQQRYLDVRMVPHPQKVTYGTGPNVRLDLVQWIFAGPEEGAEEIIRKNFQNAWQMGQMPYVRWTNSMPVAPEGYVAHVKQDGIMVAYADLAGLRHALQTLRQLSEPCRCVRTISGYILPEVEIEDAPACSFRGVHFCVFPETEKVELEKMIRLAAYFKLNTVVLESWGVFPFASEPDFCWEETPYTRDDFRDLVRLGGSLGLTVVPALNLVGHAPWSTGGKSGKFAVLNQHPEYSPLFEPDGWCWCFSNPETRIVLSRLVNELCDVFDNPPYFLVGSDEADSMACCSECVKHDTYTLFRDHLLYFHDLLKARGTRMLMWHDMLVDREDPRWAGFTAFGYKEDRTPEVYKELPRDIVICDWEYDRKLPEDRDFPISKFFTEQGFQTLLCSCDDQENTIRMGRSVQGNQFFGMLGTTWLSAYGRGLQKIFYYLAQAAWNPTYDTSRFVNIMETFSTCVREMDRDAGIRDYEHLGRISKHQNDPDKMFKPI